MTFKYNNVYINGTSTITGPYEARGPFNKYYDNTYSQKYYDERILSKVMKVKKEVDLHISGDLLNQIVSTNYASATLGIPLIGIYSACSTSVLGLILGSNMLDSDQIKNCVVSVSSHKEKRQHLR